jgi:hypothetical protein
MKVIYKYPFEVNACTIDLPMMSRVVCFHEQNGTPTAWIEQDTDNTKHDVKFRIVATGEAIDDKSLRYCGTCFIGLYVWHLYSTQL